MTSPLRLRRSATGGGHDQKSVKSVTRRPEQMSKPPTSVAEPTRHDEKADAPSRHQSHAGLAIVAPHVHVMNLSFQAEGEGMPPRLVPVTLRNLVMRGIVRY
jgi:hypothetical protein